MSEKSCETCKYYIDGEQCKPEIKCNYSRDGWQPKEEKMRKPIFKSEEEAVKVIRFSIYNLFDTEMETKEEVNTIIKRLKDAGYIRRSPVEEAEEMRSDLWSSGSFENLDSKILKYMDKLVESIQYLKERQK